MLPGLVRDVRVMTFGWDWKANSNTTTAARKAGRLTSVPPAPTSESGIRQTAVKLLDELIKSAKDVSLQTECVAYYMMKPVLLVLPS